MDKEKTIDERTDEEIKIIDTIVMDIACNAGGKCEKPESCIICQAERLFDKNYRKIPEGAVVFTKKELDSKHIFDDEMFLKVLDAERELGRKEAAREIFSRIETRKKRMHYKTDTYRFAGLNGEILRLEQEFGFEREVNNET